jgi:DNA processing protein
MKNIAYLVALHSIEGLGNVRLKRLLDAFEDPKIIWQTKENELSKFGIPEKSLIFLKQAKQNLNPEEYFEQITKKGIKILTWFDEDYPESLRQIDGPPIILYYFGQFKEEDKNSVAVVGTRKITGYGGLVTEKFSSELAQAGLTIVSGLASGVDTVAHQSALKADGRTIAILGGGLNKIFPSSNFSLAREIAEGRGVVATEFPPDYPSMAGNFPARNRIVAGLCLGVLVTEAAEDSGSLITARLGIEQGKEVFAVPGPITSSLSNGTAYLIKQGARIVTSSEEVLEGIGWESRMKSARSEVQLVNLSDLEQAILGCLAENKHIDEICRQLKKPSFEVSGSLIKLEIAGVVKNLGAGNYSKAI